MHILEIIIIDDKIFLNSLLYSVLICNVIFSKTDFRLVQKQFLKYSLWRFSNFPKMDMIINLATGNIFLKKYS